MMFTFTVGFGADFAAAGLGKGPAIEQEIANTKAMATGNPADFDEVISIFPKLASLSAGSTYQPDPRPEGADRRGRRGLAAT